MERARPICSTGRRSEDGAISALGAAELGSVIVPRSILRTSNIRAVGGRRRARRHRCRQPSRMVLMAEARPVVRALQYAANFRGGTQHRLPFVAGRSASRFASFSLRGSALGRPWQPSSYRDLSLPIGLRRHDQRTRSVRPQGGSDQPGLSYRRLGPDPALAVCWRQQPGRRRHGYY